MLHHYPILINQLKTFRCFTRRRNQFHGTTVIHTQCPLCNVKHMSTPVCYVTTAIFFKISPVGKYILLNRRSQFGVELIIGGGTNPCIPVESGTQWLCRQIIRNTLITNGNNNFFYFTQIAVSYQLTRMPKISVRTLHTARLEYNFIFTSSPHHSPSFLNSMRHGLFTVHMFPRIGSFNCLHGMPMVWSGNNYRINVFPLQNLFVIIIRGKAFKTGVTSILSGSSIVFFEQRMKIMQFIEVYICPRYHIRFIPESSKQAPRLFSCPDKTQVYHITGSSSASTPQHMGRYY